MLARSIRAARATLLLAVAISPAIASAQARPATQHVLSRGVPDAVKLHPYRSARANEHEVFGRIDGIRGTMLAVRTRAGNLQRVDASEAVRTDTYSAPLFVGKVVLVSGYYDTSRTLLASSVMRMGELDASTPADR